MSSTLCDLSSNEILASNAIHEAIRLGVTEFCICPGKRNAPLVIALSQEQRLKKYHWFEERSAAFFALGRARRLGRPVAVVTTSGTAVGELLPAVMEAHYTGTPLLLITADRPRRFRGTGAPQTAEQVGIFKNYTHASWDLAEGETCDLSSWERLGPAHLNICFEEPLDDTFNDLTSVEDLTPFSSPMIPVAGPKSLDSFLSTVDRPFVVVSTLKHQDRESVVDFLVRLNAPVYLEGISGIREHPKLEHLRIHRIDRLWERARTADYPIDSILRIGGVPTLRPWRDLVEAERVLAVCSISHLPFPGLHGGTMIHTEVGKFLSGYMPPRTFCAKQWQQEDRLAYQSLLALLQEEPRSEPSLFCGLSMTIPLHSHVYLGNSMPIREWDMAASYQNRGFDVTASRGLNGIDGQIATFLGLGLPERENWAILGDLTTLYDMAGPWIISQLENTPTNIVVVNNGGGKIFSRIFPHQEFQNEHALNFEPLARFWGLQYERWEDIPLELATTRNRLIELVPDNSSTDRFWKKLHA